MKKRLLLSLIACIAALIGTLLITSKSYSAFTWKDGVANTYHNMSAIWQFMEDASPGGNKGNEYFGNNYREVCVYCHTPHAANTKVQAPLWNRTINTGSYSMYQSPTMNSDYVMPNRPGDISLACLSCHDGTIAMDSIINMPGSGKYSKGQEDSWDFSQGGFLDQWDLGTNLNHKGFESGELACLACHSTGGPFWSVQNGDFAVYNLGIDLTNDHPIGMPYPNNGVSPVSDPKFRVPDENDAGKLWWFENPDIPTSNTRANDSDIKLFGAEATVECASCHNPHGTLDENNDIIRPFLRADNTDSKLCLTCHIK